MEMEEAYNWWFSLRSFELIIGEKNQKDLMIKYNIKKEIKDITSDDILFIYSQENL